MTTVRAGGTGGTPLEARVRRSLAWYPREWRELHGDAMMGALLDLAEATDADRLPFAQRLDLARNGVAQRLVGWAPAPLRTLAANSALLGATAFALFHFVFFEWEPWASKTGVPGLIWGPFITLSAYLDLAWLAAALLFLCGWAGVARVAFGIVGAGALGLFAIHYELPGLWPYATTLAVYALAAVFVIAGSPGRPRHSGVAMLWLFGVLGAIVVAFSVFDYDPRLVTWFRKPDTMLWFLDQPHVRSAVIAFAVAALLIIAVAVTGRRALAARLLAAALPWLLVWAVHLIHDSFALWAGDDRVLTATHLRWILLAGLAVACLIGFALLRARALARPAEASAPNDQEPLHG